MTTTALATLVEKELTRAIDECIVAWRTEFRRKPTVNELVSAFEVCVSANPDDYVDDAATILALRKTSTVGSSTPEKPIDPDEYEIAIRDASPSDFDLDGCDVWQKGLRAPSPGSGDVRAIFEVEGDTLIVDVWFSKSERIASFAQAHELLHFTVMRPYMRKKKLSTKQARYRSMDGLELPVTVPFAWMTDD
jgi:hypothetical protein